MRWLPVVLLACKEEDASNGSASHSGPGGDAWPGGVALGTGATGYEPLDDGDAVGLLTAGQGGVHVEVAGQVTGMTDVVALRPEVRHEGQPISMPEATYYQLVDFDAGTCEGVFYGVRALLDLAAVDPCALDGADLELSVEVENLETGEVVSDSVLAVGVLASSVLEDFCD